ncbi:MAG: undecaprenyl-phosphate glucose phosphotransferase [Lachnospiraceae bacterium]|nr:undecaprenyl-phosphate glucose phosphotransferase [Lachnospiraceae bacterium]
MIKDNQKYLNRLRIVFDALIVVASFMLAYKLRFGILTNFEPFKRNAHDGYVPYYIYVRNLFYILPTYMIVYYRLGLYRPYRTSLRGDAWKLIEANIIGILVFTAVLYAVKENNVSRWIFPIFAFLNYVVDLTFRVAVVKVLRFMRKKNINQKHILIVGYSRTAEAYIDRIRANREWGYHIHGILDDTMAPGTIYKKTKVIGRFSDLERYIDENDYDEIAITLSINEYGKLERLVAICEKTGIHTKFIPDYHNIIPTVPYMEDLDGLPVINIRNVPLSNTFNRLLKRVCDIIGGLMMLIIFGIPMIIIAIAVKCSSEGPVLFEQVRIGLHGRPFKMYKFRSMTQQKEADEIHAWTTANDARVTKIGKIIRRTSLDELPQIFNIIAGDMSIVGPRPERPFWVEKFKEEIPRYMIKHQVRPGLTGWAQINGYRGDTSIKKRIEYDLYYIENWKLSLDIKILFITIFKGFRDPNAY